MQPCFARRDTKIHTYICTNKDQQGTKQTKRHFVLVTKSFIVTKQKGIPQHNQSNQTIHEKPMHQKNTKGNRPKSTKKTRSVWFCNIPALECLNSDLKVDLTTDSWRRPLKPSGDMVIRFSPYEINRNSKSQSSKNRGERFPSGYGLEPSNLIRP